MGANINDVYAKVCVEDASIPWLGLANLIHPHAGTVGKAFVALVRMSFGGLWIEGRASVSNGVLYFRGGRISSGIVNQNVDCAINLAGTGADVRRGVGGLFPSSREITIFEGPKVLRFSTPRGHGDALAAAIQSWQ